MRIENIEIKNQFEGNEFHNYIEKYNHENNMDISSYNDYIDLLMRSEPRGSRGIESLFELTGAKLVQLKNRDGYLNQVMRDSKYFYTCRDFCGFVDICDYSTRINAYEITMPKGEVIYILCEYTNVCEINNDELISEYVKSSLLFESKEKIIQAYNYYADSLLPMNSFELELEKVKLNFKKKFPLLNFKFSISEIVSKFNSDWDNIITEERINIDLLILNHNNCYDEIRLYDYLILSDINNSLMNKISKFLIFFYENHNNIQIQKVIPVTTMLSHQNYLRMGCIVEGKSTQYEIDYKRGFHTYSRKIELPHNVGIIHYLSSIDFSLLSNELDEEYKATDFENKLYEYSLSEELSCLSNELEKAAIQSDKCIDNYFIDKLINYVKVATSPKEVVDMIINDTTLSDESGYAKLSKISGNHWYRLKQVIGDKCFEVKNHSRFYGLKIIPLNTVSKHWYSFRQLISNKSLKSSPLNKDTTIEHNVYSDCIKVAIYSKDEYFNNDMLTNSTPVGYIHGTNNICTNVSDSYKKNGVYEYTYDVAKTIKGDYKIYSSDGFIIFQEL